QRLVDRRERHARGLEAEAREPARRGSLVSVRLRVCEDGAHGGSVGQPDTGQLARRIADQIEVAQGECAAEARVAVTLDGHERMFASRSTGRLGSRTLSWLSRLGG